MTKAKSDTPNAADRSVQRARVNRPLPYDPVVEAIRILARRGRQLREAEERAVAPAAAGGADDDLSVDTH